MTHFGTEFAKMDRHHAKMDRRQLQLQIKVAIDVCPFLQTVPDWLSTLSSYLIPQELLQLTQLPPQWLL